MGIYYIFFGYILKSNWLMNVISETPLVERSVQSNSESIVMLMSSPTFSVEWYHMFVSITTEREILQSLISYQIMLNFNVIKSYLEHSAENVLIHNYKLHSSK